MHLTTTFLRGLGIVLPIALTIYLVVRIARAAETLLKPLALLFISDQYYNPGSGVVLGIVLIYLAGLLVKLFVIEWLLRLGQRILERTPLVKSVYNALNDFVSYVSRRPSEDVSRVVSVRIDDELSLVGFITDSNPTQLFAEGDPPDRVAVYLPMSYQVGGYTLLLPRERLRPLNLGVEEAMRLVLTRRSAATARTFTGAVWYPGYWYGWYWPYSPCYYCGYPGGYWDTYERDQGSVVITMADPAAPTDSTIRALWFGAVNGVLGGTPGAATQSRLETGINRVFELSPYLRSN